MRRRRFDSGLPQFSEAAISFNFDSATLVRAREYARLGRVIKVDWQDDDTVYGLVQGSRGEPYEQEITIKPSGRQFVIDGECTCPVKINCKHVAAVMIRLIQEINQEQDEADAREFTLTPEVVSPTSAKDPLVETWLRSLADGFAPDEYPAEVTQRLFYVLTIPNHAGGKKVNVELMAVFVLKAGGYGKATRLGYHAYRSGSVPRYVLPSDVRLIARMERGLVHDRYDQPVFRLEGPESGRLIEAMVATGRCAWKQATNLILQPGPVRPAELHWVERESGSQVLEMVVEGTTLLPTSPPYYVDLETGECGLAETGLPDHVLRTLLQAPEVRPEMTPRVREIVGELLPERSDLLPAARKQPEYRVVTPVPHLTVKRAECSYEPYAYYKRDAFKHILPIAKLEFDYDGTVLRQSDARSEIRRQEGEDTIIMPRQSKIEGRLADWLNDAGWTEAKYAYGWKMPKGWGDDYIIPAGTGTGIGPGNATGANQLFYEFLKNDVPLMREQGWRVDIEGGLEVPRAESLEWQVEAHAEGNDWFGLDLGVLVDGEKVDLRPVLVTAIRTLTGSGRLRSLDDAPEDMEIYHELPGGKVLALPIARLRPLVKALAELFGPMAEWPEDLRFPAARASEAAELDAAAEAGGLQWKAPERLRELSLRLARFEQISPVPAPAGLKGDLRPYQAQGVAWLQFLREFGFAGILADDMGLGKTIQTLAHVLTEKEAGRLDRPVFIVAPTSTLPNWRAEAERFAPSLRTLVLHGPGRAARFGEMPEHDLVITSYALLVRDKEILAKQPFHLVVLDEAQNIKNPASVAAKTAVSLDTRHRVCLTGTPVENNLEELWSLFHFLMPGFLGGLTQFRRKFRTPIETHADPEAQRRLHRMTKPFVLRRTKEQVATELPPKTEIVERIELTGAQRDLYESLRLAMDKRVRDLIANQGFNRSRIEILDALLKLRQACCDPRLVKLETAKEVKGSAKLDRLMEMLGELRNSDRRVLVFSQFTSMLDLIEGSLRSEGYEWVRISGETKDRETPVKRFQAGEVPIFLISLKAGGTGLNLTAADTVIHYDPWWNPAVERQATDRAHRIGQEKSVFVFKLVATGTVEEKILELQDRKAQLAGAVLGDEVDPIANLTADDLRWIFEG